MASRIFTRMDAVLKALDEGNTQFAQLLLKSSVAVDSVEIARSTIKLATEMGFVTQPRRGHYALTEKGKKLLEVLEMP